MVYILKNVIIIILSIVCIYVLLFTDFGNQGKVYDCSLAEWHPDIPLQVRAECRRLQLEQQQEERNKTRLDV
jgi:hypothetical protein